MTKLRAKRSDNSDVSLLFFDYPIECHCCHIDTTNRGLFCNSCLNQISATVTVTVTVIACHSVEVTVTVTDNLFRYSKYALPPQYYPDSYIDLVH